MNGKEKDCEWSDFYGYPDEDNLPSEIDQEGLTIIDEMFTRVALGWDDG